MVLHSLDCVTLLFTLRDSNLFVIRMTFLDVLSIMICSVKTSRRVRFRCRARKYKFCFLALLSDNHLEMSWKYMLVIVFLLQLPLKAKSMGQLQKIIISTPDAICNDDSRAVFYIGRRPRSSKWIIFFESGGVCSSKQDCNKRYLNKNSTVLMSSKSLPDEITGKDVLSSSETDNPTFYNYNHVLVPYCSSDLWLGLKSTSTRRNGSFHFVDDPSVDNFSFRGQTIFRSVFKELVQKYNLEKAKEIVVSGSSAGGIGVLNHANWLTMDFANSSSLKARFLFVIDSAWFINFQDGFKSRVNPEFARLANIKLAACADFRYGYSCCLSASCVLTHHMPSTMQIAFVFSLYDIYMFADVLKRLEDEGKTAEDHVADFLSAVSMYGGAMNESLEIPKGYHASFYVPACFQHTFFSTSSLWDSHLHPLVEVTRDNGKFR